jgi:peptide/nickel transport system substrate-binding protein
VVRNAFALCVDKQAIVDTVLNGLGSPADSLVPEVNPWHYRYGSAPGETPIIFDPIGARALLYANGWNYRLDGSEITAGASE